MTSRPGLLATATAELAHLVPASGVTAGRGERGEAAATTGQPGRERVFVSVFFADFRSEPDGARCGYLGHGVGIAVVCERETSTGMWGLITDDHGALLGWMRAAHYRAPALPPS